MDMYLISQLSLWLPVKKSTPNTLSNDWWSWTDNCSLYYTTYISQNCRCFKYIYSKFAITLCKQMLCTYCSDKRAIKHYTLIHHSKNMVGRRINDKVSCNRQYTTQIW